MAKKKATSNSRHQITARVPSIEVGYTDICFDVKKGGKKLGIFQLSRGNLEFIPVNNRETGDGKYHGFRIGWQKFGELMAEHGRQAKITKRA